MFSTIWVDWVKTRLGRVESKMMTLRYVRSWKVKSRLGRVESDCDEFLCFL